MSVNIPSKAPSVKTIKQGFRLFSIFTIIAFAGVFIFTSSSESLKAIESIKLNYLLLTIILALFNHFCSCCQLHVLVKKLRPDFKFIHSCEATFGNMFMAAITPTQSGGGPIQMVLLKARGLSFPQSVAAGFMQFIASVSFIFFSIVFLLLSPGSINLPHQIKYLVNYGLVIMFLLGIIFFLAILKPSILKWIINKILKLITYFGPKKKKRAMIRFTKNVLSGFEESHVSILLFFRRGKFSILLSVLFATGSMLTKFVIAYIIIIAFNYYPPFLEVISVQVLLNFLVYFAPSPGASGVAEVGSALLMGMIIPKHFLGIFIILWRVFTTFIGVTIGGILILKFISSFDFEMLEIKTGMNSPVEIKG